MTEESRGIEAAGPPWSVDLLADLHAGVLDDQEAAELWPRVNADPEARAIIDALEATTADLAGLGAAPVEPMPAQFAAKLDAALANEVSRVFPGVAPVVSIDVARRRRNRRAGWITGVVAVAAAAVAAIAVLVPNQDSTPGTPVAQPPASSSAPGALSLRSEDAASAVGQVNGVRDYGALGTPERLESCLRAAGYSPTVRPAGVRPATVDGQPAVLVLMTTGEIAKFRLIALSPACGPTPLFDKIIG